MKILGFILLAALAFLGHDFYKSIPPNDIFERLEAIRKEFKTVHEKSDRNNVVITDDMFFRPDNLSENDTEKILSLMDEIGAYRTAGGCNKTECSVVVYVKNFPWPSWLGPIKYYIHSFSGIMEEEIVDDVDKAIESRTKEHHIYAFCQKTEMKNWYYCRNNHWAS